MEKKDFKNPEAEATKRQTFAIFCAIKTDVRDEKFTRWEASQIIGALKEVKTLQEKLNVYDAIMAERGKNGGAEKAAKKIAASKGKPDPNWGKKKLTPEKYAVGLLARAEDAGLKAMEKITPTPMVVQQHANVLDDNSPVTRQWDVPTGVCGFAWVVIKCKGKGVRFITGLKKAGIAGDENSFKRITRSSYYRGFMYSVHDGGQSYEWKTAYAHAFAEVLQNEGIECYSGSRLD
jgi:hypothetical protein